jgi:hypothetical protein
VVNFVNESFFLGSKSVEVTFESFLLFVECFNGSGVSGLEVVSGVLDVLSQGVEELSNSFEG